MILKSKNQSASSSILKQEKGRDRQPPLPPIPHTPFTLAPPRLFNMYVGRWGKIGGHMGGFLHSRRFALSGYEVALLIHPLPRPPTPRGSVREGKRKEKSKAMDIWIIKKQIIHISTATTATATTTVYIPRQYPCFITSRPPTPRPPPLKFEKTIKNQTTFGAVLLKPFETAIAYHMDVVKQ